MARNGSDILGIPIANIARLVLALWPAKHTDATGASTQEACRRPHEEARGFSQSETMSWRGFSSRLASLGAEIEDSVAQEVNNLRRSCRRPRVIAWRLI